MDKLFNLVREIAEPVVWSSAVELARNGDFAKDDSQDTSDIHVRVGHGKKGAYLVVLSPEESSYQCSCDEEDDPCRHVIAAIIFLKNQRNDKPIGRRTSAQLFYIFNRSGKYLSFGREIRSGDQVFKVDKSLQSTIDQLSSSSLKGQAVLAERRDFAVDHILQTKKSGILEPSVMRLLIPALSNGAQVELDGNRISLSGSALSVSAVISGNSSGFVLSLQRPEGISEVFENSAAIINAELSAVDDAGLTAAEYALLTENRTFSGSQIKDLVSIVIPTLEKKIKIENIASEFPKLRAYKPHVLIELIGQEKGGNLTVVPRIVYGDPPIAEVEGTALRQLRSNEFVLRDKLEEEKQARRLQNELHLSPGRPTSFTGEEGISFRSQLRGWRVLGGSEFIPIKGMKAELISNSSGFDLHFTVSNKKAERTKVSFDEVFASFSRGENNILLSDGSWAELPVAWLEKYGQEALLLLDSRDPTGKPHIVSIPQIGEFCKEQGWTPPANLTPLLSALDNPEDIPDCAAIKCVNATLRSYQKTGINWLNTLKSHSVGALLADDMGLGKTLQAISIIDGRTLIVCPMSVLRSWQDQITKFRPEITVGLYHGADRTLGDATTVVLTTYSILRLDKEILDAEVWDTVILDEAQTIKNHESQVAKAAHGLKARFKVALSGTPLENSLDDLWSQFRFINPGVLKDYSQFTQEFSRPILRGDQLIAQKLSKRVKPFILRRTKNEVLKDLPPKTEIILRCELSEFERDKYNTILAASRDEVLKLIEEGASVFSILEVLLRLRQASCHPALLPGLESESSSKVDLLVSSLENSVNQGHPSLVFSQWTSLLDLIEPHLKRSGIPFLRLDGSTADRGMVVESFQDPKGPPVMLLSLKAGGVGLTLTRADHVYMMDPWWNPAVEDQAADRAHRIGQERAVFVYKLIAAVTLEEKILELQEKKRGLLTQVLSGDTQEGLTKEELIGLLA